MDSDLRQKAISVLRTVLNKEQNITTIEKNIDLNCRKSEVLYNRILYQTLCDIKSGNKLNNILSNIKEKKILWNHSSLEDYIFEEQEQNNFIIQPFEVHEGAITCACGSNRVYSYQKQSRSADEPMSTYSTCMACGKKWQYSG
jgi:transcription elongation factor S-II